ncbi:MAG TPA: methyltransferase domain-containing protein, partial [Acidimicrobiales bacterium]|nr:methyltransferase domain-containing protein [Acidimicrobiales bacterium]
MGDHGAPTTGHVLHWARGYDVLVWVLTLGREGRFRRRLADLAHLEPGAAVLDVGCGTGGLAIAAKGVVGREGQVCGVDPSPEMVERARRKAARAGVDVGFETAAVESLPFDGASFDVVLSSLMLHHLTDEVRRRGTAEIARVLRPGGRFLAVDIGGGKDAKRHGFLHRLPRHAGFDLQEIEPVLDGAGFHIVEQGPIGSSGVIGLSDLRFILADT